MNDLSPKYNGKAYTDHLILYMDILGYSDLMLEGDEVQKSKVLELQRAVCDSDKSGHTAMDAVADNQRVLRTKPLTSLLSDTLVYSFPIEQVNDSEVSQAWVGIYHRIATLICGVQDALMRAGMLVRGAVTIGKIINHEGMCYGEGLARAYNLEKGKPPFIFFDDIVRDHMDQNNEDHLKNYIKFESGNAFFDFLRYRLVYELNDSQRDDLFKMIDIHLTEIKRTLNIIPDDKVKEKQKWKKMDEYYSFSISKHNANNEFHPDFQIEPNPPTLSSHS